MTFKRMKWKLKKKKNNFLHLVKVPYFFIATKIIVTGKNKKIKFDAFTKIYITYKLLFKNEAK